MAADSLTGFIEEAGGGSHLRIEHDFGDGFVRLRTSEAERRQAAQDIQCSENIVLELLRNSRDAHATSIFLAVSKEDRKRTIVVIDNGDGIPPDMHEHVFEPRVTSKLDTSHMDAWGLHGRGMALYSIKVNAQEARVQASDSGLGCSIRVRTDTSTLKEKTDQSSFPTFEMAHDGTVNIRGPKNILRTACEFAIEARNGCSVYIGSPAEIASTIYAYGKSSLSPVDRAFSHDIDELPLMKRLATAGDPEDFSEIAAALGLGISTRTARRILDGQLQECPSLLDSITISKPHSRDAKRKARLQSRKISIGKDDRSYLAQEVSKVFGTLAEQYYLEEKVDPSILVRPDCLQITIPLIPKD